MACEMVIPARCAACLVVMCVAVSRMRSILSGKRLGASDPLMEIRCCKTPDLLLGTWLFVTHLMFVKFADWIMVDRGIR